MPMEPSRSPAVLLAVAALLAGVAAAPVHAGETCLECHELSRQGLAPHPMGIDPTGRIPRLPENLPLPGGRITCLTCHVRHGYLASGGPERATGTAFLRARPPELCAACHRDAAGRWDRPHAIYADTVHGGSAAPASSDRAGARRLDPFTLRCLRCHDGSEAPDVAWQDGAPHEGLGRSHPVGVLEPLFAGAARRFRPPGALRPELRLFDGRVGCLSCHRLFGERRDRLAMDVDGSRLCLGCHDL